MRPARLAAAAGIGYLFGTVPSADVAARAVGVDDLRTQGSGNPGAANAMHVLGRRWGYGVLAADVGKAAAACAAGRRLAGSNGAHLAGTAAVVGHCHPVWNGFRGGKGVAASVGQCLATFPVYTLPDLAVAGLTGALPWWRRRALAATVVSSVAWVAAAIVWARRSLPNLWGPEPGPGLPMAAAASSAVIVQRFLADARTSGARR